ncbi:zinc ribbon domain-containing protein [Clostridium fermenticellae]|nr:zinc ribbon domain-containing protein [Clostridium fermenticellae]
MICPNCSSEIEDDSLFCSVCGSDLRIKDKQKFMMDDESHINKTSNDNKVKEISSNNAQNNIFKIFIALAIIGCALFFISAEQISKAGDDMITLRSEAGTSLAEVYYQDVGRALKGFAMFARGLGVSILAIVFSSTFKKHKNN